MLEAGVVAAPTDDLQAGQVVDEDRVWNVEDDDGRGRRIERAARGRPHGGARVRLGVEDDRAPVAVGRCRTSREELCAGVLRSVGEGRVQRHEMADVEQARDRRELSAGRELLHEGPFSSVEHDQRESAHRQTVGANVPLA